jgi:hypothetical protein
MGRVGTPTRGAAQARTILEGRPLQAARAAWIIAAILAVGVSIASVPVTYAEDQVVCTAGDECPYWRLVPEDLEGLRELGLSASFYAAYMLATDVVYLLGFWAIGAVIFWRKSDDRVALFSSIMLVTFGAAIMADPSADIHSVLDLLRTFIGFLGYVSFYAFFYVFPDGRFVPRWTRWPLIVLALYEACLLFAPDDSSLDPAVWPYLLPLVLTLSLFGTMAFAQLYRYLRVSGPAERQKTKWVVLGLTAALAGAIAPVLFPVAFPRLIRAGVPNVLYVLTEATVATFSLLLIPLSIGIAILRHHLWDIDLIINRTIVYSCLSAVLTVVFSITDTLLQSLFFFITGVEQSRVATFASVIVIAVAFQPMRNSIQGGVNRLVGQRIDGAETREAH